MNIINIEHISKIYGEKTIYEDASFGRDQRYGKIYPAQDDSRGGDAR